MAIPLRIKHSSVSGKAPQPADLRAGELALNINEATPAAYFKDSAGNVIKIAGPDVADGRYLRTDAAAGAQIVQSTDKTEFKGGIKVTGGTAADVEYGLRKTGITLSLVNDGVDMLSATDSRTLVNGVIVIGNQSINLTGGNGLLLKNDINYTSGDCSLMMVNPETITGTINKLSLITARTKSANAFNCEEYIGVEIQQPTASLSMTKVDGSPTPLIGVSSSIGSGTDNYNFFAKGGAKNYFTGPVETGSNIIQTGVQPNTFNSRVDVIGVVSSVTRFETGSSPSSGAGVGARINALGFIESGRASGPIWRGFEVGKSAATSQIYANGDATFEGTVTATVVPPSDARFKENITPAKPQLADVVALGGILKNYDWNEDAPLNEELRSVRQLGLIAQEVEAICPTMTKEITKTKTVEVTPAVFGDDGEVTTEAVTEELDDSYKGISNDALIMKMLGAITELKAEVDALKAP